MSKKYFKYKDLIIIILKILGYYKLAGRGLQKELGRAYDERLWKELAVKGLWDTLAVEGLRKELRRRARDQGL